MRKFKWSKLSGIILCSLLLLVGCKQGASSEQLPPKPAAPSHEEILKDYVSKMPLEAKVGQMLLVGIPGTDYDGTAQNMVEKLRVGGIIHFDRNLSSGSQVQALNASLQQGAGLTPDKLPLFIAVDQEGGQVARMRNTLTVAPAAADLGAAGKPQAVKDWAVKTAQSLKKYGFNTNFAPVADLDLTNRRSYGTTPESVTPMVEAALAGYAQEKVMCSLKHFPGIGRMTVDPHLDTSAINASQQELQQKDMAPFLAMVNKRPAAEYMIMVSHLVYPAFDSEPSSVSKVFLTDVLRKQWQYKGIIITDDMAMGGLSKVYSNEVMGVKAVEAGADILLSCSGDPDMTYTIYNKVLAAVKQGQISRERIDASVVRILAAKEAMGIWHLDTGSAIK